MAKMYTIGSGYIPAPNHAGGLRYHGMSPIVSELYHQGEIKETGEEKTILFGLTGTGYFDLYAYEQFNDGNMTDYVPSDEEIEASLATLPNIEG